jgi:hypothetical protein
MKLSSIILPSLLSLLICFSVNAQDTKTVKPVTKSDTAQVKTKKTTSTKKKTGKVPAKVTPAINPKVNTTHEDAPETGKNETDKPVEADVRGTKQIITEKANGSINWTQQYITAKGASVLDTVRFSNPSEARMMATRGAMVVAQRNLLEIIKGVQVTSETTVKDMVATNDNIFARIDGVVKGAQQVGEPVVKDGMVELTMHVPLYETNGLAPVLYDNLPAPKGVRPAAGRAEASADTSGPAAERLAFNFAGKKIDPSMFPVIVDENNNIVLDMAKIYNPKTGKFPKIIQASKTILNQEGYKNAVKVLDVLDAKNGKIVIDNASVKKVNWAKIGKTAGAIGKILMMLI